MSWRFRVALKDVSVTSCSTGKGRPTKDSISSSGPRDATAGQPLIDPFGVPKEDASVNFWRMLVGNSAFCSHTGDAYCVGDDPWRPYLNFYFDGMEQQLPLTVVQASENQSSYMLSSCSSSASADLGALGALSSAAAVWIPSVAAVLSEDVDFFYAIDAGSIEELATTLRDRSVVFHLLLQRAKAGPTQASNSLSTSSFSSPPHMAMGTTSKLQETRESISDVLVIASATLSLLDLIVAKDEHFMFETFPFETSSENSAGASHGTGYSALASGRVSLSLTMEEESKMALLPQSLTVRGARLPPTLCRVRYGWVLDPALNLGSREKRRQMCRSCESTIGRPSVKGALPLYDEEDVALRSAKHPVERSVTFEKKNFTPLLLTCTRKAAMTQHVYIEVLVPSSKISDDSPRLPAFVPPPSERELDEAFIVAASGQFSLGESCDVALREENVELRCKVACHDGAAQLNSYASPFCTVTGVLTLSGAPCVRYEMERFAAVVGGQKAISRQHKATLLPAPTAPISVVTPDTNSFRKRTVSHEMSSIEPRNLGEDVVTSRKSSRRHEGNPLRTCLTPPESSSTVVSSPSPPPQASWNTSSHNTESAEHHKACPLEATGVTSPPFHGAPPCRSPPLSSADPSTIMREKSASFARVKGSVNNAPNILQRPLVSEPVHSAGEEPYVPLAATPAPVENTAAPPKTSGTANNKCEHLLGKTPAFCGPPHPPFSPRQRPGQSAEHSLASASCDLAEVVEASQEAHGQGYLISGERNSDDCSSVSEKQTSSGMEKSKDTEPRSGGTQAILQSLPLLAVTDTGGSSTPSDTSNSSESHPHSPRAFFSSENSAHQSGVAPQGRRETRSADLISLHQQGQRDLPSRLGAPSAITEDEGATLDDAVPSSVVPQPTFAYQREDANGWTAVATRVAAQVDLPREEHSCGTRSTAPKLRYGAHDLAHNLPCPSKVVGPSHTKVMMKRSRGEKVDHRIGGYVSDSSTERTSLAHQPPPRLLLRSSKFSTVSAENSSGHLQSPPAPEQRPRGALARAASSSILLSSPCIASPARLGSPEDSSKQEQQRYARLATRFLELSAEYEEQLARARDAEEWAALVVGDVEQGRKCPVGVHTSLASSTRRHYKEAKEWSERVQQGVFEEKRRRREMQLWRCRSSALKRRLTGLQETFHELESRFCHRDAALSAAEDELMILRDELSLQCWNPHSPSAALHHAPEHPRSADPNSFGTGATTTYSSLAKRKLELDSSALQCNKTTSFSGSAPGLSATPSPLSSLAASSQPLTSRRAWRYRSCSSPSPVPHLIAADTGALLTSYSPYSSGRGSSSAAPRKGRRMLSFSSALPISSSASSDDELAGFSSSIAESPCVMRSATSPPALPYDASSDGELLFSDSAVPPQVGLQMVRTKPIHSTRLASCGPAPTVCIHFEEGRPMAPTGSPSAYQRPLHSFPDSFSSSSKLSRRENDGAPNRVPPASWSPPNKSIECAPRSPLSLHQVEQNVLLEGIREGNSTLVLHLLHTKPQLLYANNNLLHQACNAVRPNISIVKALLKARPELVRGVDATTGKTALHVACAAHHADAEVVTCLILQGILVDAKTNDGLTAFHMAVMNAADSSTHRVKDTLLAVGNSNVDERTADGRTALHMACVSDANLTVVRYLVVRGADLLARVQHRDRSTGKVALLTPLQQSRLCEAEAVTRFLEEVMLEMR